MISTLVVLQNMSLRANGKCNKKIAIQSVNVKCEVGDKNPQSIYYNKINKHEF